MTTPWRCPSRAGRTGRHSNDIWTSVEQRLVAKGLLAKVDRGVDIKAQHYEYKFKAGWHNGVPQVAEPISFDYLSSGDIIDTATKWSGRLLNLGKAKPFQMTGIVAGPVLKDLQEVYAKALAILRESPNVRKVVAEDEIDTLVADIERDILEHQREMPSQSNTSGQGKA